MPLTSRHLPPKAAMIAACLAFGALPSAAAQTDSAIFDVSIRGIPAATLSLSGAVDGDVYAVNGVLKSSGLFGFFRKIRYDAKTIGHLRKGRYVPDHYVQITYRDKSQSEAVMGYKHGVPQVKTYTPPRPPIAGDVDPRTQGGTIDPLSALFAVLRDVPAKDVCKLKVFLFDGRERSQIVLASPQSSEGAVTCAGEYRRLAGFSPEDMAEKSRFSFSLAYAPADDGMYHVTEVSMDTLYGKGRMIRR